MDTATAAHLPEAQRKGMVEVAQHGYSHTPCATHLPNQPSEFYGRLLQKREDLIPEEQQCLSELFGCPITGFVPPRNSGDDATLEALANLGHRHSCSRLKSLPRGARLPSTFPGRPIRSRIFRPDHAQPA